MRNIGIVTSIVIGAIAALGAVVGVRSIPDIQRYLKIRSM